MIWENFNTYLFLKKKGNSKCSLWFTQKFHIDSVAVFDHSIVPVLKLKWLWCKWQPEKSKCQFYSFPNSANNIESKHVGMYFDEECVCFFVIPWWRIHPFLNFDPDCQMKYSFSMNWQSWFLENSWIEPLARIQNVPWSFHFRFLNRNACNLKSGYL